MKTFIKNFFAPFVLALSAQATCATELKDQIPIDVSDAEAIALAEEQLEIQQVEDEAERLIPLTPECIHRVSSSYGIHHDILFALLIVEGGTVGKTNKGNTDGTKDLSLFQMNEINLPELKNSFGITREEVLNNGCLGAALAARHLLKSIQNVPAPTNRMEYLSMIARYHSATPKHNAAYALKLDAAFKYLGSLDEQTEQ